MAFPVVRTSKQLEAWILSSQQKSLSYRLPELRLTSGIHKAEFRRLFVKLYMALVFREVLHEQDSTWWD